jgi:hypothetical protein
MAIGLSHIDNNIVLGLLTIHAYLCWILGLNLATLYHSSYANDATWNGRQEVKVCKICDGLYM